MATTAFPQLTTIGGIAISGTGRARVEYVCSKCHGRRRGSVLLHRGCDGEFYETTPMRVVKPGAERSERACPACLADESAVYHERAAAAARAKATRLRGGG